MPTDPQEIADIALLLKAVRESPSRLIETFTAMLGATGKEGEPPEPTFFMRIDWRINKTEDRGHDVYFISTDMARFISNHLATQLDRMESGEATWTDINEAAREVLGQMGTDQGDG